MQIPDVSAKMLARFHFGMMLGWTGLVPVTLFNPESILWVAVMSHYANFVGHFAGWDAARGEQATKEDFDKLVAKVEELKELLDADRKSTRGKRRTPSSR